MSQFQQGLKALVSGIKQDIEHYTQFLALLKNQQIIMQRHDSEALLEVNKQHEDLYQVILMQAKKRRAILKKLGVSPDNNGISQLFSRLNSSSKAQVEQLWQQLKELTLSCQQQNDINGRLLAAQHELISKLVNPQNSGEYAPSAL